MAVAIGLLAILLSLGLLGSAPSSKPPENSWLGVVFGIAFLFAGISAIIQAEAARGYPTTAELPASSPTWLRSLRHYSAPALSYPSAPCSRGSQLDRARENSQVAARFSARLWDASPSASAQCCSGLLWECLYLQNSAVWLAAQRVRALRRRSDNTTP